MSRKNLPQLFFFCLLIRYTSKKNYDVHKGHRHMKPHNNLLWDLGNTLLKVDTFSFARHMGLADMVLYPLINRTQPKEIFDKALMLLTLLSRPHQEPCDATAQGKPLPPIVCDWLAGKIPLSRANTFFEGPIDGYAPPGFFSSKREARLVERLLQTLTNPKAFASTMRLITEGMNVLQECADHSDEQGNQRNKLYILSNWDPYSFKDIITAPHLQALFSYFERSNLIISGDIGLIKPHKEIYSYVLETYQLDPASCILIDDQQENISGAQGTGMRGILLKNGDYEDVRKQLRSHKVIC